MIVAEFNDTSMTLTSENGKSASFPYRDHPEVFGHPRFLMADFDKSAALIQRGLLEMGGRWQLIAPKIMIRIHRPLAGGLAEIDKRALAEIFTQAGARAVMLKES